jgi:ring-1,2-phenylacetyl-CoA epoxidase subunit PaaC
MNVTPEHLSYVLRLADNALILGQRNAEWCGHGPILEEDIALANMSLDLIGQARLLYTHASELEHQLSGKECTEDDYAYFRTEREFRNYTMVELPHSMPLCGSTSTDKDYAVTIVRNYLYATMSVHLWSALCDSTDTQLAAIASKSLKEAHYHVRHARDWLVRLGDGTVASHQRTQAALDHLLPYAQEFFGTDHLENTIAAAGVGPRMSDLKSLWDADVNAALAEATLKAGAPVKYVSTGKHGEHSEHMGFLLAEMQSLARQHPGARW